jgi:hypothetical protein
MLEGIPSRRAVKLRVVGHFTIQTNVDSFSIKNFIANSAYDPDYNIGGKSLTAFNQWSEFYAYYHVLGAKMKIFPIDNGGSLSPSYYGIHLCDNVNEMLATYGATGVDDMLSSKKMSRRLLVTGSRDMNKLNAQFAQKSFSAKKSYGCKVLSKLEAGAYTNSNPSDAWYFTCWLAAIPGLTTAPAPVTFRYQIDQIVMFTKPILLAPGALLTAADEKEAEKKMFLPQDFNENLPLGTALNDLVDTILA